MSNFALQLDAGSKVSFTANTSVGSATKIGGRFRILGAFLKDLGNNAVNSIFLITDGTNTRFELYCHHLFGGSGFGVSSGVANWDTGRFLDISSVTIVDANYYEFEFLVDPNGATPCVMTLYDTDGTTVLATRSGNNNITTTSWGTGNLVSLDTTISTFLAYTMDWFKLNNGTSDIFDAELNEGTGTSVADSIGATTGTISGTFTWITLGGGGGTNSVSDDAEFTPFPTTLALPMPTPDVITVFG